MFNFILLIFFSLSSYGQIYIYDRLHSGTEEKPIFKKTMPPLNLKELRYNLPVDFWEFSKAEIAKGHFMRIDFSKISGKTIKIIPEKKDNHVIEISKDTITLNNQKICSLGYPKVKMKSEKSYICGYGDCEETENGIPTKIYNFGGMLYDFYQVTNPDSKCDLGINIFPSEKGESDILEIQIQDSIINDTVHMKFNNLSYTFDARDCLKKESACSYSDRDTSNFERAWMHLESTKEQKNYKKLNYLIQNLLPCVQKKDISCVKKFFVTPAELTEQEELFSLKNAVVVDSTTLKHLSNCLTYDSLLPYGERSKAGDDKICIFSFLENFKDGKTYKIHSISLPDAYSSIGDTRVYYADDPRNK